MSQMYNCADIDQFMFAGNATFTISSRKTGAHFTYKVSQAKDNDGLWFVALLTGPDNDSDYTYLGVVRIRIEGRAFMLTKKSRFGEDVACVKAYRFLMSQLTTKTELPECLEFRHEGHCGRCGRTLTVPESIDRGIGPECWSKMGGM